MASRSQSKTTTDHGEIRQWAEDRGGHPAVVNSTRGKGDARKRSSAGKTSARRSTGRKAAERGSQNR